MVPGSPPPRRACLDSDGAGALLHLFKGGEKSANDFQSPRLAVHFKHAVIEQPLRVGFSFHRRNTAIMIRVDQREYRLRHVHSRRQIDFDEDVICSERESCGLEILIEPVSIGGYRYCQQDDDGRKYSPPRRGGVDAPSEARRTRGGQFGDISAALTTPALQPAAIAPPLLC